MNKSKKIILGLLVLVVGLGLVLLVQNKGGKAPLSQAIDEKLVEAMYDKQPAYLIDAYSKDGKSYIDVDYVEWLKGGESADGNDKVNTNPQVRTFEVSPNVAVIVYGHTSSGMWGGTLSPDTNHSFEEYVKALQATNLDFGDIKPSFKKPKDFITIDTKDNVVIAIFEPYQE